MEEPKRFSVIENILLLAALSAAMHMAAFAVARWHNKKEKAEIRKGQTVDSRMPVKPRKISNEKYREGLRIFKYSKPLRLELPLHNGKPVLQNQKPVTRRISF